jgi:copper homeostasis protein
MTDGGTTPSYGTIAVARKNLNIKLFVMIRPRSGDFLYSDVELEIMKTDIEQCKNLGVDGVVFGILTPDAEVDKLRCKLLIELARPMEVTFHRAFDRVMDPRKSLEDLIECGFSRVLTSGQRDSAINGKQLLYDLVQQAGNRIIIMPGGGVRSENIIELKNYTGAREFHTSARSIHISQMKFRGSELNVGSCFKLGEYEILGTDENVIKQFVDNLNK